MAQRDRRRRRSVLHARATCLASPAIQTISSLPSGTDAPSTLITEYAVRKYHMQPQLSGG